MWPEVVRDSWNLRVATSTSSSHSGPQQHAQAPGNREVRRETRNDFSALHGSPRSCHHSSGSWDATRTRGCSLAVAMGIGPVDAVDRASDSRAAIPASCRSSLRASVLTANISPFLVVDAAGAERRLPSGCRCSGKWLFSRPGGIPHGRTSDVRGLLVTTGPESARRWRPLPKAAWPTGGGVTSGSTYS